MKELDYDWLRVNHTMIHYFGLGFIQIKIDETRRVHVYTPELRPIVFDEDVHNHRYGFESKILKGKLSQSLFDVNKSRGGRFELIDESCKEGYVPAPGAPCDVTWTGVHHYVAGSVYYIGHAQFHRVVADDCITLVRRGPTEKELAQVVHRVGAPKVCPFSVKLDTEDLWSRVKGALSQRSECIL